nr:MAG TPA: hypothetical protein [Caudoviricetes sp.]
MLLINLNQNKNVLIVQLVLTVVGVARIICK